MILWLQRVGLNDNGLHRTCAFTGSTEIQGVFIPHYTVSLTLSLTSHLAHRTYLKTLPPPHALRTPLHFTPLELEMFKGTNLYGAALDREREWQTEWRHCHGVITGANSEWGHKFSW